MKLKVWVEIMTVTRFTEDVVEVPDAEWNALTPAERDQYQVDLYEGMLVNLVGGGCEPVNEHEVGP